MTVRSAQKHTGCATETAPCSALMTELAIDRVRRGQQRASGLLAQHGVCLRRVAQQERGIGLAARN
jgi:hypothetical protein